MRDLHFWRKFKFQESFKCAILSLFALALSEPLNRHELDIFSFEGFYSEVREGFMLLLKKKMSRFTTDHEVGRKLKLCDITNLLVRFWDLSLFTVI